MNECKFSKDWIVINSKSHPGRVYYFHIKTKKSTWRKPTKEEDKEISLTQATMARRRKRNDNSCVDIPKKTTVIPTSQNDKCFTKKEVSSVKEKETPQMLEIRKRMLVSKERTKKQVSSVKETETVHIHGRHRKKSTTFNDQISSEDKATNKDESSDASVIESTNRISPTPINEEASKSERLTPQMKVIYEKLQQKNLRKNISKKSNQVTKISDDISVVKTGKRKESKTYELTLHKDSHTKDKNNENIGEFVETSETINIPKTSPLEDGLSRNKIRKLDESDTLRSTQAGKIRSTSRKKNLAKERMEKLRKNLTLQSRDKSTNATQWTHNCTKPQLPLLDNKGSSHIDKNVNFHHKNLRKKFTSNETVLDATDETVSENDSVEKVEDAPIYEDMDWEPMEDEEIMFEVKAVRTQLCVDEHANEKKIFNLSGNTLELPSSIIQQEKKALYVVIDTNVFLSNIQIIDEVIDATFRTYERPTVVIPWIVIRELDYLKSDKSAVRQSLQASARKAVQFINAHFSSKHPRVVGQTLEDATKNKRKFSFDCPDDEILQVCLQIQDVGKSVVLLSYDKNLCTKAMIHGILTIGRDDSLEKIDHFVNNNNKSSVQNEKSRYSCIEEEELRFTNEIFEDTKNSMKKFLSYIVEKEMQQLYGDNWAMYTIIKPPWNIKAVLKCAVKHWLAAVNEAFYRQAESILKELVELFNFMPEGGRRLKEIRCLLEKCGDFVQSIKLEKYHELMAKTQESIYALKKRCDQFESEKSHQMWKNQIGAANDTLEEERRALKVFKYLDAIYVYACDVCGMAAAAVGMPCSFTYKCQNPPPSIEYLKKVQPEIAANVNRLLHALSIALEQLKMNTMDHSTLIAFYHTLTAFSPEELSASACDLSPLDVYCCLKQDEDKLRNGIHQLQELSTHFCRLASYRCT